MSDYVRTTRMNFPWQTGHIFSILQKRSVHQIRVEPEPCARKIVSIPLSHVAQHTYNIVGDHPPNLTEMESSAVQIAHQLASTDPYDTIV